MPTISIAPVNSHRADDQCQGVSEDAMSGRAVAGVLVDNGQGVAVRTLAAARRQTRAALLTGIIETGRARRIERRKRRPTCEQSSSVARSRRPGPRRATGRSGVVQGVTGPATRRVFASSK